MEIRNKKLRKKRKIKNIRRLISLLVFSLLILIAVKFINSFNIINVINEEDYLALKRIDNSNKDCNLVLVNKSNEVPKDYEIELMELSNGISINSKIYNDLQRMMDEARSSGVYPIIVEGYRSYEDQEDIMNEKIIDYINEGYSKKESKKLAKEFVALPGTSEHELGIAIDINGDIDNSSDREVYDWLYLNSF